jgi:hypothetical protein
MAGLVPAIRVFGMAAIKTWMPGIADKFTQSAQGRLLWPGMTIFLVGWFRARFSGRCVSRGVSRRRLAQTIAAQAIPAIDRHRQADNFLGAPARPGPAAGEFRSASGTGEAARGRSF